MSGFDEFFERIVVRNFEEADVQKFTNQLLEESWADPKAPIVIYISSDGGDVDGLAAMVSVLKQVPNPIHTVCVGNACSAAAFLLSYGDVRYCDSDGFVMLHKVASGAVGHVEDLNGTVQEINRINNHWLRQVAKNCGTTYSKIKRALEQTEGRDLYLDADSAKKFGIVDFVGTPPITFKRKKKARRRRNGKKK